jgi:hypothetical protein
MESASGIARIQREIAAAAAAQALAAQGAHRYRSADLVPMQG